MRTTKAFTTITYNTENFLKIKLDELVKAKKISFYCFIKHKAEEDEKKDHIHLFVDPSAIIQTDDLKDNLIEFDPKNPTLPLTCLTAKSCKNFGDAYLYFKHDKAYLTSKGQSRKYHYRFEDFRTSSEDELRMRVSEIDMLSITPYAAMLEAQRMGLSWEQFFKQGSVPIPQIYAFEKAWNLLSSASTCRNGREGHEIAPIIDSDTGEVLDDLL